MMMSVIALLAGLLFGLGLIVSGMVMPAKVLGFLDLSRPWDPSLALVMGGAIAVALPAFALAARRGHCAWTGLPMRLPHLTAIDGRLVGGSVLFGLGWGLAGLCPAPALVVAGVGAPKALAFVAAMLAGMALVQLWERRQARR